MQQRDAVLAPQSFATQKAFVHAATPRPRESPRAKTYSVKTVFFTYIMIPLFVNQIKTEFELIIAKMTHNNCAVSIIPAEGGFYKID